MKLSIITITYNSEKTIRDTVESIVNQDKIDIEYIIIDGGSTDNTLKIIGEYKAKIAKIISEKDEGISDAFNKGINNSTGDIIGIINSDDIMLKGTGKFVVSEFEKNNNIDVMFGNVIRFKNTPRDGYVKKSDPNLSKLKYTFKINHPATFVKKDAYRKYGVFSTKLKCAMDYELLSRMYYEGAKFLYVDKELCGFREGGESQTNNKTTYLEHREIALKNGCSKFRIEVYLNWIKFKQFNIRILQKLKLEKITRKIFKNQESVQ